MNNLSLLMDGFATILTWNHLMIMVIGVMLGMLVGVLPGLGAPNGFYLTHQGVESALQIDGR